MIIEAIHRTIDNLFNRGSKAQDNAPDNLLDPRLALKTHFGYDDFREGQREVVEKLLSGKNLLGAFPTAFGKSICYQLPGLMLPGLTVIISPLISLMKDQVDTLREKGINSIGLLNSSLTPEEYQQELKRLVDGEVKLLYVSPERFRSRRFLNTLKSHKISLFVVDEAHCISQWGHDFRPDYLALRTAIQAVKPYSVALFTATATPEVREDIVNQLQVEKCETLIQSVERPNLKFSVCEVPGEPEKYQLLTKQLEQLTGKGIVYAGTRRQTEELRNISRGKAIVSISITVLAKNLNGRGCKMHFSTIQQRGSKSWLRPTHSGWGLISPISDMLSIGQSRVRLNTIIRKRDARGGMVRIQSVSCSSVQATGVCTNILWRRAHRINQTS